MREMVTLGRRKGAHADRGVGGLRRRAIRLKQAKQNRSFGVLEAFAFEIDHVSGFSAVLVWSISTSSRE